SPCAPCVPNATWSGDFARAHEAPGLPIQNRFAPAYSWWFAARGSFDFLGLPDWLLAAKPAAKRKSAHLLVRRLSRDVGLRKAYRLVPGPGLEPGLSAPKADVLPIALFRNRETSLAEQYIRLLAEAAGRWVVTWGS